MHEKTPQSQGSTPNFLQRGLSHLTPHVESLGLNAHFNALKEKFEKRFGHNLTETFQEVSEQLPDLPDLSASPEPEVMASASRERAKALLGRASELLSAVKETTIDSSKVVAGKVAEGSRLAKEVVTEKAAKAEVGRRANQAKEAAKDASGRVVEYYTDQEKGRRRAITTVAGGTVAVAATYGAYRYYQHIRDKEDTPALPAPKPAAPQPPVAKPQTPPPAPPHKPDQLKHKPDIDNRTDAEKLEELGRTISEFNSMLYKDGKPTAYVPSPDDYVKMTDLAKSIQMTDTDKGAIGYTAYGIKLDSFAVRTFLDGLNPKKWILGDKDIREANAVLNGNSQGLADGNNIAIDIGKRNNKNQLLSIYEFSTIANPDGDPQKPDSQTTNNYIHYVLDRLVLSSRLEQLNPDFEPRDDDRYDPDRFVVQRKSSLLRATHKAARNRKAGMAIARGASKAKGKLVSGANKVLDVADAAHSNIRERIARTIEANDRQAMLEELRNTPVEERKVKLKEILDRDWGETRDSNSNWARVGGRSRQSEFIQSARDIAQEADRERKEE